MRKIEIPQETLTDLYYNKRMTMDEIAEHLKVDRTTVMERMKEHRLPTRRNARYIQKINIPKRKTTLAYIAGLFDGEGCIGLYPRKDVRGGKVVMIQIGVTDKNVIDWLSKVIGGGVSIVTSHPNPNYKLCYKWRLQGVLDDLVFLKAIYPYLKIKKQTAKQVIEYLEWKRRTEVRM
jgi:hypothetical protein